jgi:TPR repeat protein
MNKIYFFILLSLTLNSHAFDIKTDREKCDKNDMFACARMAKAYKEGTGGLTSDYTQELKYIKKSCILGFRANCEKIKITKEDNDNINIAFSLGVKIGQNGYIMLEKMCAVNNAKACYYLSDRHDRLTTEKDKLLTKHYYEKAKTLREESCANNDATSCEWLYHQYARKHQETEAAQYLQQATALYKIDCDNKIKGSCLGYELCRRIK